MAAMVENAKLRELVKDMWFWRYEGHIFDLGTVARLEHFDDILDRMCELGIEV